MSLLTHILKLVVIVAAIMFAVYIGAAITIFVGDRTGSPLAGLVVAVIYVCTLVGVATYRR